MDRNIFNHKSHLLLIKEHIVYTIMYYLNAFYVIIFFIIIVSIKLKTINWELLNWYIYLLKAADGGF